MHAQCSWAKLSVLIFFFAIINSSLWTQNPVPLVNQPLVPAAVAPGGPDFTLTVNGTGFVSGATVNWNGAPLATTFVGGSRLTATVPAANTSSAGAASITVVNPNAATLVGKSNVVYFPVDTPESAVSLSPVSDDNGASFAGAEGDFNGD
jgi:IPT/TIG domain